MFDNVVLSILLSLLKIRKVSVSSLEKKKLYWLAILILVC